MEMTFLKTACRTSNLSTLLQNPDIKATVEDLSAAYDAFNQEDQRGTRVRDVLSPDQSATAGIPTKAALRRSQKLSEATLFSLAQYLNKENKGNYVPYWLNIPKRAGSTDIYLDAIFCSKVMIGGVSYKPAKTAPGSSNALLRPYPGSQPQPAIIQEIFAHRRIQNGKEVEETFLAVKYLVPLESSHEKRDPYRRFPQLGSSLWKAEVEDRLAVIRPANILCHFAKTKLEMEGIPYPCFNVMPLNRVSPFLYLRPHAPNLCLLAVEGAVGDPWALGGR